MDHPHHPLGRVVKEANVGGIVFETENWIGIGRRHFVDIPFRISPKALPAVMCARLQARRQRENRMDKGIVPT